MIFRRMLCAVLAAVTLLCGGCHATQAPAPVETTQPSFDGNQQNSGIVDSDDKGFHVTQNYRDRYNALLGLYGVRLVPARKPGDADGITPENPASPFYAEAARWVFTVEARNRLRDMNAMRKADQHP